MHDFKWAGASLMDDSESKQKSERRKQAVERKQAQAESMDEAWDRIFAMKNSDSVLDKLKATKYAMAQGIVSRDPADMYTKTGKARPFSKSEALKLYEELREIRRKEILTEMADNVPSNYELVLDYAKLDSVVRELERESEIVFDVETTGTRTYEDVIVGVVLSAPSIDKHYYIPTNHESPTKQLDRTKVLEAVRHLFEDARWGKIAHNGKFDIHMLANHGIGFENLVWDTQVAMHVLNENEPSKRLKDLATKFLGIESMTYEDLFGKRGFDVVDDLKVALAYAAKDGDITWKLAEYQRYHMKRTGLLEYYETTEVPLVEVIVRMERAGFVIDFEKAKEIGDGLAKDIERLDREMRQAFGVDEEFNFGSPKQLSELLYGGLGMKKHLRRGMKLSTNEETLNVLAEHHPGIAKLLEYRQASKLYGTYFDKLPKMADAEGIVRGTFMQDGTVTGRLASKDPNLQNQPKYARQMFRAPDGYFLLTGDFSQQEPRILTHYSGEPLMVDAYTTGKDLYSEAAAALFNVPVEECGDKSVYRGMMKTGILAVMYGTTAKTLSKQLKITPAEAQKFIDDFYAKYTEVARFIRETEEYVERHGYVKMMYGRKRRLPKAVTGDEWEGYRAKRQATNAMMQGSAAIQTKKTMIRIDEWARKVGGTLSLQVHDELGAYVPYSITPEQVREFEEIMVGTVTLDVPNKCDIEIQTVWGEGVEWDSEKGEWIVDKDEGVSTPSALEAVKKAGAFV